MTKVALGFFLTTVKHPLLLNTLQKVCHCAIN
jgi:hypothetical protein